MFDEHGNPSGDELNDQINEAVNKLVSNRINQLRQHDKALKAVSSSVIKGILIDSIIGRDFDISKFSLHSFVYAKKRSPYRYPDDGHPALIVKLFDTDQFVKKENDSDTCTVINAIICVVNDPDDLTDVKLFGVDLRHFLTEEEQERTT